jgi:tRNA pseudouridine55 synthase
MIRDGIINLLKPAGMTSHDCVQMLRRLTGIKRIGHTGTLDPMAVGVLPLCIGSAARITEYLDLDCKKYRCEMQLGLETDTQDIWGRVVSDNRNGLDFNIEKISEVLNSFRGLISQRPPAYSAVRVNGKRLYEYARQGEKIEIKPRLVNIKNITVIHMDPDKKRVLFDVECSKGTYIRTICHDAGRILGCGAAMSCLIRTASGAFTLDNAVTVEELREGNWERHLLETDFPLVHFGSVTVNKERGKWFTNGGMLRLRDVTVVKEPDMNDVCAVSDTRGEYGKAYKVYLDRGGDASGKKRFLGVAIRGGEDGVFKADKVFTAAGAETRQGR